MSNLVVIVFDGEFRAHDVRIDLLKKEKKHLADFEDAIVIQITAAGEVKLHSVSHQTLEGIIGGGFLGSLLGLILLNPVFALFGLATGAIAGGVSGSMSHVGISEEFIQELAEHLKPGTSALCVLVSRHLGQILKDIAGYGGKVLQSSLLHEDEAKLLAVLDSIKSQAGSALKSKENDLKPCLEPGNAKSRSQSNSDEKMEVEEMDSEPDKWMCAHCGYEASGRFSGDICPGCGLTYWKCGQCGYLITAAIPPDSCPDCGDKSGFKNVTCYTPECGGPGNIDPRL